MGAIDAQRIPAPNALKEWGTAHRFAGSGDRAAIARYIDVLRRRASSAWLIIPTRRARERWMLKLERGLNADAVAALCDGGRLRRSH